jgi:cytidylate kinase
MAQPIREGPRPVTAAGRPNLVRAKPLEVEPRAQPRRPPSAPALHGIRYVALSREAGSGGEDIAKAVAERLGWTLYDKDRLNEIVEQLQVSGTMLDLGNETPIDWGSDIAGSAADRRGASHDKDVTQLRQAVFEVSKRGNAVFIGRAAQFILPRSEVLAVRIVASQKYRLLQIAAHTGVAESAVHQSMQAQDQGRREFVQRFFHRDLTDPHEFDLVINVELCGQDRAANLILAALGGRIAPFTRASQ